jgi:hypothetical protein
VVTEFDQAGAEYPEVLIGSCLTQSAKCLRRCFPRSSSDVIAVLPNGVESQVPRHTFVSAVRLLEPASAPDVKEILLLRVCDGGEHLARLKVLTYVDLRWRGR